MQIVALELDLHQISSEIQEKFAFKYAPLSVLIHELKSHSQEVFILSTSNRWAVYAYVESVEGFTEMISKYPSISENAVWYANTDEAVYQLFTSAAGLNANIDQQEFFAQLKLSKRLARKTQSIGPVLDECLKRAISINENTRNLSRTGRYTLAVARAGLGLIKRRFKEVKDKNVLLIGTGRRVRQFLDVMDSSQYAKVYIASHSYQRTLAMSDAYHAYPLMVSEITTVFESIDIVIGGVQEPVSIWDDEFKGSEISYTEQYASIEKRSRIFIDLSKVKNFQPHLNGIGKYQLFNLDELKYRTSFDRTRNVELALDIKKIISLSLKSFESMLVNGLSTKVYQGHLENEEEVVTDRLRIVKKLLVKKNKLKVKRSFGLIGELSNSSVNQTALRK